jgi:hypothetical protein
LDGDPVEQKEIVAMRKSRRRRWRAGDRAMSDPTYLLSFPKSIPPGRVLLHNHVPHTIDMRPGLNGFRAWTGAAPTSDKFKPCRCGWSGLPHYSAEPDTPCVPSISEH